MKNRFSIKNISLFLPVFLVIAGCTGKEASSIKTSIPGSPPVKSPEQVRKACALRYPDELYITAWGSSSEGYEEAEAEAVADVSSRISSTIHSAITASTGSIEFGSDELLRKEYAKITEFVSEFEHGELIAIDEESCYTEEGIFFTMAFLDRNALLSNLEEEYKKATSLFSKAYGSCILAFQQENIEHYSMMIGDATGYGAELMSLNNQIRAATGYDHPMHSHHLGHYLNLLSSIVEIKSKFHLTFEVTGSCDPSVAERLSSLVLDILHELDYRADIRQERDCDSEFEYNLIVRIWQLESQSHFGHISRAEIRFDLYRCADQTLIWSFVRNPAPGVSTNSVEAAGENLIQKIVDPDFIGNLRDILDKKLAAAHHPGITRK